MKLKNGSRNQEKERQKDTKLRKNPEGSRTAYDLPEEVRRPRSEFTLLFSPSMVSEGACLNRRPWQRRLHRADESK